MIPFNIPYLSGTEEKNFSDLLKLKKFSGDGFYTKKCSEKLLEIHENIPDKILLTTSCTDALEMVALLLDIKKDDEIIIPAYTFVSTALAFELRGAKIKFVDSEDCSPNVSAKEIEKAITKNTKAIVIVHYAGIPCDIENILNIANKNNIPLIEDNAQGLGSKYKNRPLGTFGCMSTISFHESKNIQCGEGGALVINDNKYSDRAEIIREKGTNRTAFFSGKAHKYEWWDIGSSFLMSDILSSFLFSQLNDLDKVKNKRKEIYEEYKNKLSNMEEQNIKFPILNKNIESNYHIFYMIMNNKEQRDFFIKYMFDNGIYCAFHYLSLNKSEYFKNKNEEDLLMSDKYSDCLVRLPIYPELSYEDLNYIIYTIKEWNIKYGNL